MTEDLRTADRLVAARPSRGRRARVVAAAVVAGAAASAAAILGGCPSSSTTTTYTPITGIEISSADLIAGRGCGTQPGQVYRFAAIVSYDVNGHAPDSGPQAGTWTNVFDCFDPYGYFENLLASDGGNQLFSIIIYAWNAQDFPPQLTPCNGTTFDAGTCPAQQASAVLRASPAPDWTTTCTAFQEPGTPVIADCNPLEPPDGGAPASESD